VLLLELFTDAGIGTMITEHPVTDPITDPSEGDRP
jgi:hypothetical protein